ncbi:hypothetical protein ACOMHN_041654 [Nucella lapillus]
MLTAIFVTMTPMTSQAMEHFNDGDESWNLDRTYRHAHARDLLVTSNLIHDRAVMNIQWSGVQGCRHRVPVKSPQDSTDDLLPQSSTCPWTWVINYDPRRTPSTLLVAHCTCPKCLSAGSTGHRCQPVHYFRRVVYFKDTPQRMERMYRLAVGCTCERHAVRS